MNQGSPAPKSPWTDATLVACVVAVDPTCGVVVKARAGPVRDQWLVLVRGLLPLTMPWRRVPLHATDARLLGGLDFAATLAAGRPIAERGLLSLLAPVIRVTGYDTVIPLPRLERQYMPSVARIVAAVRKTCNFS